MVELGNWGNWCHILHSELNDWPKYGFHIVCIHGQSILGDENFVGWVKETFLEDGKDRERPSVRQIRHYLSKDIILSTLGKEFGVGSDKLNSMPAKNRQICMTMLYNYGGMNNREIGEFFCVDYSTVSQGRKRLREKLAKDQALRIKVQKIEEKLSMIKIWPLPMTPSDCISRAFFTKILV